jgi:hypothetical protein
MPSKLNTWSEGGATAANLVGTGCCCSTPPNKLNHLALKDLRKGSCGRKLTSAVVFTPKGKLKMLVIQGDPLIDSNNSSIIIPPTALSWLLKVNDGDAPSLAMP